MVVSFIDAGHGVGIPNFIFSAGPARADIDVIERMLGCTFLAAESLIIPDRTILRASRRSPQIDFALHRLIAEEFAWLTSTVVVALVGVDIQNHLVLVA